MKKCFSSLFFGILFVLMLVAAALANPYLQSDKNQYPSTGVQPEVFVVLLNGTMYVSPAYKDPVNGAVYLNFDLVGKWATGANSVKVLARNMWGDSVYCVPLSFNAGAPVAPSGVGLSAN